MADGESRSLDYLPSAIEAAASRSRAICYQPYASAIGHVNVAHVAEGHGEGVEFTAQRHHRAGEWRAAAPVGGAPERQPPPHEAARVVAQPPEPGRLGAGRDERDGLPDLAAPEGVEQLLDPPPDLPPVRRVDVERGRAPGPAQAVVGSCVEAPRLHHPVSLRRAARVEPDGPAEGLRDPHDNEGRGVPLDAAAAVAALQDGLEARPGAWPDGRWLDEDRHDFTSPCVLVCVRSSSARSSSSVWARKTCISVDVASSPVGWLSRSSAMRTSSSRRRAARSPGVMASSSAWLRRLAS